MGFHESFRGFPLSVNMQECLSLLIRFSSFSFPGLLKSLPGDHLHTLSAARAQN